MLLKSSFRWIFYAGKDPFEERLLVVVVETHPEAHDLCGDGLTLTADRTFARHIGVLWARSSVRLRLVQSFVKEASVALFPSRKVSLKRKQ